MATIVILLSFTKVIIANADIYKFVTIDGVETFTDTPVNKKSKLIIKSGSSKNRRSKKQEKVHEISVNEIVSKTVQASLNPESTSAESFIPRLPPVGGRITSTVGYRTDPIDGKRRHHNGIDIAIPEGTPVTSVGKGVVVYSGLRSGYGYTVLIEHDNGIITLYGHNSRLMVSSGQPVDSETVIALSGNTGRSTGPHLHFEAWQSGSNITAAFMPNSTIKLSKSQLANSGRNAHFRREVLADGSVLFTNLPSTQR